MADHFQFEAFKPAATPDCRLCEELLADAVDDVLMPEDKAFFDRHIAGCAACMAALADARRGSAWLAMIKTPRPEPSAQLLDRILLATSGSATSGSATSGVHGQGLATAPSLPELPAFDATPGHMLPQAWPVYPPRVLPFRPRFPQAAPRWNSLNRLLFEPRLAMTAAMAFFSIALTLSLAGVHLNQLHARDLGPSGLRRSYYEATASVSRRCEGLRVVHTVEARLDDLRQSTPDDDVAPGTSQPESRRDLPRPPASTPAQPAAEPPPPPPPTTDRKQSEPKNSQPNGGVGLRPDALTDPIAEPRVSPLIDQRLTPVSWTIPTLSTHKEGGLA